MVGQDQSSAFSLLPFAVETISVQLRVGGQSQKYMKCSKDQYCYPAGQIKYQI